MEAKVDNLQPFYVTRVAACCSRFVPQSKETAERGFGKAMAAFSETAFLVLSPDFPKPLSIA